MASGPVFDAAACVGCGLCEEACPERARAIRILPFDGELTSNEATATITVQSLENPPVGNTDTYETEEDRQSHHAVSWNIRKGRQCQR